MQHNSGSIDITEGAFREYGLIYRNILSYMYPAKNSTGFAERNLSVNFSKAYEKVAANNNQIAYSWFEFQFGNNNNLHVDAVIMNKTTSEMFVVESKRYNNPSSKLHEVGEDIDRIYDLINELYDENDDGIIRINMDLIDDIYGVILADIWSETQQKTKILREYKEKNFLKVHKRDMSYEHEINNEKYEVFSFDDMRVGADKYNLVSFWWRI